MKVYWSGLYKPRYGTEGSAGLDLCNNSTYLGNEHQFREPIKEFMNANVEYDVLGINFNINPGDIVKIESKTHVEIPIGYVGFVFVRSSLGFKGLDLINSVGVIDSDYRGEIGMKFINRGKDTITIATGERVAQLVVVPYINDVEVVDELSELDFTERGVKGFGSTGKK